MPPKEAKPSKEPSGKQLGSSSPSSRTSDDTPNPAPTIPPPPPDFPRLQQEEQERKDLYETAQANFKAILEEAINDNIKAYRAVRERIAQCADDVQVAQARVKVQQEKVDASKKALHDAREELENVKKAYDLNTEVWWQAERTIVSLKKDEMAKLQMVQALVDWREAEVALHTHELLEQEKAKDIIEKPYLLTIDLWKTGEELKRLGVNIDELEPTIN